MRKLYLCMMLVLTSVLVNAQTLTIGNGTTASAQSPWDPWYGYSYTQTIYLGSEINGQGNITSISYYYAGTTLANNQDIKVYMGVVSRSSFTSTTNWEPLASLTLVYDGTVGSPSLPGWVTITLTTPFAYNSANGNLLIAVDENTSSYDGSSSTRFRSTAIGTNRSLYYASDGTNPNPSSPPSGTRSNFVGNIQIDGLVLGCQPPSALSAFGITTDSAHITWDAASGGPTAASYDWEVRTGGVPGSGSQTGLITAGNTSGDTVVVGSLTPITTYTFYARSRCGTDSSGWTSFTFTTLCATIVAPTAAPESFTTVPPNACWTRASGLLGSPTTFTSTTSTWTVDDFANVPAKGTSARVEIWTTTIDEWLITPSYNLGTAGNMQMEFDMALTVYNTTAASTLGSDDKFAVLISTDNGDTWSAANILREWNNGSTISNTGEHVIIDLSTYTGVVKFAFYGESTVSGGDVNVYIDNFEVKVIPACAEPLGIFADNITTTGATINWTASTSPSATYQLYYSSSNVAPADTATPMVTGVAGTSTNITGLNPQTTYYVWVRSNCGATGNSEWSSSASFITLCVPVTSFSQNFDGVATPGLPTCWGKILRGATIPAAADVTTTTTNYSAPNSAYLYNSSATATDDIILVSPQLSNVGAGTHRLRFYARNGTASQDLEIGTLSDNTASATFTLYQTVDLTTTWAEYTVDFTGYGGPDQYIGFRRLSTSTFTSVYMDNIVWEQIPSCLPPTDLQASNATTTTATLNWNPSATPGMGYQVYYSTSSTAPLDTTAAMMNGVIPPSADLTGLTPGSVYYVWVRTNCGSDTSAWSASTNFTTLCAPITTPSAPETFATYLPSICWREAQGPVTGPLTGTSSGWIGDDYGNVAAKGRAARMNIYTTAQDEWLVSPQYDLGTSGTMQLQFDLIFTGYDVSSPGSMDPDDKFIVLLSTDDGATWTALREWNNTTPISTLGQQVALPLNGYTGLVRFGFYAESTVAGADNDVMIDNVAVQPIPACVAPTIAQASNVTINSATIEWTASISNPTNYQIYYSTSSAAPDSATTPMQSGIAALQANLTNLASGTTYYVWVRSNCAGSVSNWSGLYSFNTPCVVVSTFPYNQGVEGGSLPPCFSNETVSGSANWTFVSQNGNNTITPRTGNYMAEFRTGTTGNATKLVLPVFDLTSLTNPELSFYMANVNWVGDIDELRVFYKSSAGGSWTQIGPDYTSENTSWTEIRLPLPNPSSTYYIAFEATSNWARGLNIDDVRVGEGTPMPVTLSSFNGERAGKINRLTWTTATESNNKGFELERSADGRIFNAIAFVKTKAENGNSTAALSYLYHDERPLAGGNYYRLKQVDNDGRSTYSSVVYLKGDKADAVQFTILYPNPAKDVLTIGVAAPASEKVVLLVTDITGKVVLQQAAQLVAGDNQVSVQINRLASGTYLLKAVCANGCQSAVEKFVKH